MTILDQKTGQEKQTIRTYLHAGQRILEEHRQEDLRELSRRMEAAEAALSRQAAQPAAEHAADSTAHADGSAVTGVRGGPGEDGMVVAAPGATLPCQGAGQVSGASPAASAKPGGNVP